MGLLWVRVDIRGLIGDCTCSDSEYIGVLILGMLTWIFIHGLYLDQNLADILYWFPLIETSFPTWLGIPSYLTCLGIPRLGCVFPWKTMCEPHFFLTGSLFSCVLGLVHYEWTNPYHVMSCNWARHILSACWWIHIKCADSCLWSWRHTSHLLRPHMSLHSHTSGQWQIIPYQ